MVSNQNLPTYPIISSSSGWPWIAKKKRHLFSPTVTHGFTQILGSTVSKRGTTGQEIPHETPSGMSFRQQRRLVWYAILNNLPKQLWEMVCPSLLSNQPVRRVISLLIGILYIYHYTQLVFAHQHPQARLSCLPYSGGVCQGTRYVKVLPSFSGTVKNHNKCVVSFWFLFK